MADIIDFRTKKPVTEEEIKAQLLLNFANDLDKLITIYRAKKTCELGELGAIVSNRLGEILRILPNKQLFADHFINIVIKQAGV